MITHPGGTVRANNSRKGLSSGPIRVDEWVFMAKKIWHRALIHADTWK